jgi:hypothetical protein
MAKRFICSEYGDLHQRLSEMEIDLADATEHLDDLREMVVALRRGEDPREILTRYFEAEATDLHTSIENVKKARAEIVAHFMEHHGYVAPH